MAKTTFSSGVTVTSAWLNGAKQIYFDGQDLDWHYDPLGLSSLVITGPNGLDSRYITLGTDQPTLDLEGKYAAGAPISGSKVVTGTWNFGYDQTVTNPPNPPNTGAYAPKSYTTNTKYNSGGSTIGEKYAELEDEDLITKKILNDQFLDRLVDNGYYYVEINGQPSNCNNYSIDGTSTNVCPTA